MKPGDKGKKRSLSESGTLRADRRRRRLRPSFQARLGADGRLFNEDLMESTPLYSFFNVFAPPTRLLHPSEGGGGGEANGGRLRMRFVFFFSTATTFRPFLPFLAAAHHQPLLTFSRFTFCCRYIVTRFILSPSPPATLPPPGLLLLLLLLLYSPIVLFSQTLYIKHTASGEIKESRRPGTDGEEIEAAG